MPLTDYQAEVARLLSAQRTLDSYLAGGAALHLEPNSTRYSNDLDYFQDSEERVASAFEGDRQVLTSEGYTVETLLDRPGFVRAVVKKGEEATKVEWVHDTAWRFLPALADERVGYMLHPVDLAINKLLALVGRDEARDLLDTIETHQKILPLGALVWAAVGKDPGFSPQSLLELLSRRGRFRPDEFERLHLKEKVDPREMKATWLKALEEARAFVETRSSDELGALFFDPDQKRFVMPAPESVVVPHFGRPGGVLPQVRD